MESFMNHILEHLDVNLVSVVNIGSGCEITIR